MQTGPMQAGAQLGGNSVRESRPMDQINSHAVRVSQLAARVQTFLNRFNGEAPQPISLGERAAVSAPTQISYSNALARLSDNLETLASNIEELEQIG